MFICKDLLTGLDYECIQGKDDRAVSAIVNNSRKASQDDLFICIAGANTDGHDYAQEVAAKGVAVLVVEKEIALDNSDVTVIKVTDTRYAMAIIAAAFFGHPAEAMNIIGITGTKGKTTTAYMIKSILEQAGHRVGLIGTIEVIIGEEHIPTVNTTPESLLIQQYFRQMADAGCDIVVMEAASQGFKLSRTAGFVFDIGIFTNLEPDHIGPNEHADFTEYLACKGMLFRQCRKGIVNRDDKHWEAVTAGHLCEIESFGMDPEADIRASGLHLLNERGILGISFAVSGLTEFWAEVATPGKFSVYNALAAIAVCRHFEVPVSVICKALIGVRVPGRIEVLPISEDITLLIDYAHNAMSLESLLTALREYRPRRLVCLFGCGGDRSRLRRSQMGEGSGKLADLTVITSDNPRTEQPQAIIDDIKSGIAMTGGSYVEIIDRREAIRYVITNGRPGDIIVLAGKGHEVYQEINGEKYPMDERVIVRDIVASMS